MTAMSDHGDRRNAEELVRGVTYRLLVRGDWEKELANAACAGLVQFFKVLVQQNPEALVPPYLIDEAWHEALIDTRRYPDFCQVNAGRYIQHEPPLGPPRGDVASSVTFKREVSRTISYATTLFGELDERVWNLNAPPWQRQLLARSKTSI